MKTRSKKMVAVFAAFMVLALGSTWSEVHGADWELFSTGLNQALQSSNTGLQHSAMRLIIKYGGENLNVKASLKNIIRIYETATDKETKELALLTIFQIDKKKAAKIYVADLETETETMRHVIDQLRNDR